jgi:glycerophosphoryl diester phosphodiesterase
MNAPRTFVFCGHRGNMADSPENTLRSFSSAERVGVDEIELDVRVTKDGVLVVIHDRTVERTAATATPHLRTPVEDLTFDELRTVDLGHGQRIPTLVETLDSTTALLQVEIKAPAAARELALMLSTRSNADQARCLVTSFHPLSLSEFSEASPGLPRGTALHVPDLDSNWRDDARRLDVSTILLNLSSLTRALVDEMHDSGYRVGGSLLAGPADVRRILELDVDASSSDSPGYARQLLGASAQFGVRFPSFSLRESKLSLIGSIGVPR